MRDPGNADIIDDALALWFPAPRSETGEDVAELQLHGGRAVIAAVLGGRLPSRPPLPLRLFVRFPVLRRIPARLVGMGIRPEHIRSPEGRA